MIISTALEASRGWGITLNRLAWGAVVMYALSTAFKFDGVIDGQISGSSAPTLAALIVAVALFLAANLVGAGTVALGYNPWVDLSAPEEDTRLELLRRVLDADRPILTTLYYDLIAKQDAIAGFYGALVISLPCVIIYFIRGESFSGGEAISQTALESAILLVLGTCLIAMLRLGANSSERFLLAALSNYEQLGNNDT